MVLGLALAYAGIGHLTTNRTEFQAQVPTILKSIADFVVLASGVVEIVLGLSLIFLWRYRVILSFLVGAIEQLCLWPMRASLNPSSASASHTRRC